MFKIALAAWLFGTGLDGVSTPLAMARGGQEQVLTVSPASNVVIIGGEAAAGAWGLKRLYVSHPKLAVGLGIGLGALRAGVAAHNLRVR